MIASTDPLQFDEPTSVAIGEHLQKYVHAKPHNKLGHIIVSSQRANKIENVYMLACEKIKKTTLHWHNQVE